MPVEVPMLDELVERPERMDSLSIPVVCALLGQISALQTRLAARLAMLSLAKPREHRQEEGDRLLTARVVAERLGRGVNWVYANSHEFPFVVRAPGRRPRYSERGLEQWIRAMQKGA